MANPVETILRKRAGQILDREELHDFVTGFLSGRIDSAQMAALLMAIYFQGMTETEVQTLTEIYIESGARITFPKDWHTVDKHSTGGVGDKVSLPLAAIVAACGARIPMISGRGLGHTGGTLDKLESIPGLRTDFSESEFRRMVETNGLAIISQSQQLVPADGRIYALRDVTGTVESLPLITASIMSKKLAEGAQNLVVDLKVGSGAFMKTLDDAERLAMLLAGTGNRLGQRVTVVFTDMEAPLGLYAGNALEVRESIEYLQGESNPDLDEVTQALSVEMLLLSGHATTPAEAGALVSEALTSGRALEVFREFIAAQNGDPHVCDDFSLLPVSPVRVPILAPHDGWVMAADSQSIGYALVELGAGRKTTQSVLDYGAGAYLPLKIGTRVKAGETIGEVYAANVSAAHTAAERIARAYSFSPAPVEPRKRILKIHRDSQS